MGPFGLGKIQQSAATDGASRFATAQQWVDRLEQAQHRNALDDEDLIDEAIAAIRDHEGAHVDTLVGIIQQRGGDPVAEACYDFGADFTDPEGFLGLAQLLENTGVMAYDGAIASIKSGELQTAGATIATIEARHASYLNLINGDNPFPDAFDTPKAMQEILDAAGGFIVACP